MKNVSKNVRVLLLASAGLLASGKASLATDWAMKVGSNGNVGIGTENPNDLLEVLGNIRINTATGTELYFTDNGQIRSHDNNHRILFRRAEDKLELREYGDLIFSPGATNGTETAKMVVTGSGNVGIGTKTPNDLLEVLGDMRINTSGTSGGELYFTDNGQIRSFDNNHRILFRRSEDKMELREFGDLVFSPGATSGTETAKMVVAASGNVGIGTTNPVKAALEIDSSALYQLPAFAYFAERAGPIAITGGMNGDTTFNSIYASQRIVAVEFDAFSDARIKNIKGKSDSKADLKTLLGIAITDYTYRDHVTKGTTPQKKVIAQQLDKVFPQAVSKNHVEVVPDIMKTAKSEKGKIFLPKHGLKKNDRVKLVFDNNAFGIFDVLSATSDIFEIASTHKGKVFVYGREVHDFHAVDFSALTALNISATQEIYGQMQEMKKEMDALREEIKALKNAKK